MPLISLIIPCFNHGRFLPDAVKSILVQTLQDFEIIIVNDCSTDDTLAFCADVMTYDMRIKTLCLNRNGGTAVANNFGLRASKGRYLTIMSADDMRKPESFERLYTACKTNPHHFAYDDMTLMIGGQVTDKIWKFPEFDGCKLLEENTIHTGIMFERQALLDTGGYPPEFGNGREDWAFNLLLTSKGYCGIHVDYPGYIYRRGDNNRTLTNTTPEWQEYFKTKIRTRFADLYNGSVKMSCCGQRYPVNSNPPLNPDVVQSLVGAQGMVAIEYIGGNFGTTSFFGPITGTAYRFDAAQNKKKMVDVRDLHTNHSNGLLDLREHTRPLFKIADVQPAPAPVDPEPSTGLDAEAEAEAEAEADAAVEEMDEVLVEGTPLETLVSKSSPNYQKLLKLGIATVEMLRSYPEEELQEKSGISKSALSALLKMAKDGN